MLVVGVMVVIDDVGVVKGDVRLLEVVMVVVESVGVIIAVGVDIVVCTDVVEVDCNNVWIVVDVSVVKFGGV